MTHSNMLLHNALPQEASEGFQDASAYNSYLPAYPEGAVEIFLKRLKVADQNDMKIVEIAAGTGKFTELLAKRPERFIVKAVEPHVSMRSKLAEKDLQAVEVVDGTAERMPTDNEWGDACIAAQFATPEALKEVHRVLRPGAVFGAIWNIEDYNKPREWQASTKWEQKLNDFIFSLEDGLPRFRHLKWREIFEKQPPGNPFSVIKQTFTDHLPKFSLPIGEDSEKWTIWLSEDALWSRLNILSQTAVLKERSKGNAARVFKEALQSDDVEKNDKGEIAVHGVTHFFWTDTL